MKRLLFWLWIMMWIGAAVNAQDSLLIQLDQWYSPARTRYVIPERFNAASMSMMGPVKQIELTGMHQSDRLESNGAVPEGDRLTVNGIQTYGVVSKNGRYSFGMAGYEKGSLSGRNGHNALDAFRTGPYVLMDTIGGKLYYESYYISGALTFPWRKSTFGMGLDYKAQNAYRKLDPRVQSTVSDFSMHLSLMRQMGEYFVGIGAQTGRYSQNVSSRNYRPDRKDYVFYHYGLGNYGKLFSGTTDNSSMDYSGFHLGANGFILPAEHTDGFYLWGDFNRWETQANYGKIHPGVYRCWLTDVHAGYWMGLHSVRHKVGGFIQYQKGKGTEYVYEVVVVDQQTQLTDYRLLTQSSKYLRHHSVAGIEYLLLASFSEKSSFSASGRILLRNQDEKYAASAKVGFNSWNGLVELRWQHRFKTSWLSVEAGFDTNNPLKSSWKGVVENAIVRHDTYPQHLVDKQQANAYSAGVLFVQALKGAGAIKGSVHGSLSNGSYVDRSSFSFMVGYIF